MVWKKSNSYTEAIHEPVNCDKHTIYLPYLHHQNAHTQ